MIKAQILGINKASVFDITAIGKAPVLALCRKLLAAGYDPATPLQAYRGDMLCLKVRSIGEGAKLAVRETTKEAPYFVAHRPFPRGAVTKRAGPPIE